jgi:glycosyltransferase involved in cell wall biosynthesis
MVAAPSVEAELRRRGFGGPLRRWSRGVDLDHFHPRPRAWPAAHCPGQLYVGRVSVEKNLDAFLSLKTEGKKYVVGDGPARPALQARYPGAVFLGKMEGERLAEAYANADVFVFPSRTDTFSLVILEALASGVPVAAYPAPGPVDILTDPRAGALDDDLSHISLRPERGFAGANMTDKERRGHEAHSGIPPVLERLTRISTDLQGGLFYWRVPTATGHTPPGRGAGRTAAGPRVWTRPRKASPCRPSFARTAAARPSAAASAARACS